MQLNECVGLCVSFYVQVCSEGVVISPHIPSLSLTVVILMSIPDGKESESGFSFPSTYWMLKS